MLVKLSTKDIWVETSNIKYITRTTDEWVNEKEYNAFFEKIENKLSDIANNHVDTGITNRVNPYLNASNDITIMIDSTPYTLKDINKEPIYIQSKFRSVFREKILKIMDLSEEDIPVKQYEKRYNIFMIDNTNLTINDKDLESLTSIS